MGVVKSPCAVEQDALGPLMDALGVVGRTNRDSPAGRARAVAGWIRFVGLRMAPQKWMGAESECDRREGG